ncbi:metallophosphoesterase [Paractinoplanes brasiliensis]|uniref:Putative MPP superfamily phosphohydrolase n=1 Tax=Paractinoplanes brasiliensis TaxID=52695 RepID=A0A4R6JT81_9ACTN|nr:metallophosphoesterase [Actinoplanes brasiliensis]TDO39834.1 putative MPP superfamily phosphohydrolase [Actinoplanes brasiliensis]
MRKRSLFALGSGVFAAGAATLAYASLIERNLFTLRRFDVPVLEPDAEPLRILHLSDLHMMPDQRRKQAWVAALSGCDPDLVVVTGDNLADKEAVPGVLRALDPLLSVPGAFVFGSNDYRGPRLKNPFSYLVRPSSEYDEDELKRPNLPTEELRAAMVDAGWADLNNARTVLKAGGRSIELAGVDDPHINRDDYAAVAGPISPGADVHLGVTHTPASRVLNAMANDGFDLLLAGHTHGGQVCVPFYGALTTNCDLPKAMAKGLHRWPGSDAWLHVSAGLGTHPTAPVRFSCRPEASILTLIPR